MIWAASISLLVLGAACLPPPGPIPLTALAGAVLTFASMVVLSNAVLSQAYSAAAPYQAGFLVAGMVVGRRLDGQARDTILVLLAVGSMVLAAVALWQIFWIGDSRATAQLEAPATLATLLNVMLLPVIVFLAFGDRPLLWAPAGIVLATALAATVSRGGMLGLLAGLFAAAYFARRQGLRLEPRRVLIIVAVLATGWLIAQSGPYLPRGSGNYHELLGAPAQASSVSRLELYALAWEMAWQRPAIGVGYLGFRAVLDANRDKVPTFTDSDTYFVHNDYLQVFLELGLPGLAAFAAMILLPFTEAMRAPPLAGANRLFGVAMLASIASMAMHATVDFPFYVPICLLAFGVALGVLDGCIRHQFALPPVPTSVARQLRRIGLAALAGLVLVPPAIADGVAHLAHRAWRNSDGPGAAFWYEVARRIEPRDWRYHLYAGQFWYAQAAQTNKNAAARLADEAFAAGMSANPVEVRNLLGRISTHRRFAGLLEAPADAETMRAWVMQAASIAPHHPGVRAELARNSTSESR